MSRVEITNIDKYYGAQHVVDGLSLVVEEGEFCVLLGPSGCGKTTTLRCVAGLEVPTRGQIRIGADVVTDATRGHSLHPSRRDIGMVFQSYALWPHMNVFANVAYPLRARRKYLGELHGKVGAALEIVGLSHLARRYPSELSGGQQQRVALARAIVSDPGVLLFDEPLSNLDAQLRQRLREDLRRLHDRARRTALYVTHDHAEALALADRIAIMRDGRIEQVGMPEEVFARPETRYVADFVGYENFLPATVIGMDGGATGVEVPALGIGLRVREPRPRAPGERLLLAMRPSATRIVTSEDDAPGIDVEAELEHFVYMGEFYACLVSRAGHKLKAVSRVRPQARDGKVTLRIGAGDCALVSDQPQPNRAS